MDLPDNLNLESNEKSDDEEDEGRAENLYRFLEESHIEVGGQSDHVPFLSIERRGMVVGFCVTIKKLQIHLCIKIPTYQMQAKQEVRITFSFTSLSCTLWSMLSHVT